MFRSIVAGALLTCLAHQGFAQGDYSQETAVGPAAPPAVQRRIEAFLEAFNKQDAAEAAASWSPDAISTAEDSDRRLEGREAIRQQFAAFFKESPGARLAGQITAIDMIRPDVATIEGRTTLVVGDTEPVVSTFAATLVKDGDDWLIHTSHQRDVPRTTSPYEALQDLEWMIGTWQDQSQGAMVVTTVRWSPGRTFLIRSFNVQAEEDERQGTQIIGWDPSSNLIRTWIFHSDGSFGQGTISRHDNAWMMKMSQTLADGRTAAGTQVITRVDDDTVTVQVIGETLDGELLPTSAPVRVVRTADASGNAVGRSAGEGGTKP